MIKNMKIRLLLVNIACVMFLILFCINVTDTTSEILITRYVSIEKFFILGVFCILMYTLVMYFVFQKINVSWEQYTFYGIMLTMILVVVVSGYITHGESIRSMLANDKNDALMDFFNSIQYGMKPYENGVIYPPLINVIYGFLGRYSLAEGGFATRVHQMGSLVYGIYAIAAYGCCIYFINRIKTGILAEKFLFVFVILFSLPFLFTYDRGNSILLVLSALMIYLYWYRSDKLSYRLLSYGALGMAAGIKISPAIFGLLLIRERKWKDVMLAILVGIFLFIAPFFLTDGNIVTLIDNIRNTDNMRDVINLGGIMVNVGGGAFVNTVSLFEVLGRYLNINLSVLAVLINYILLTIGTTVVIMSKRITDWQVWSILVGIMVLLPAFSAVYNLILFTIPLILFLNYRPTKSLKNVIILMLFIGIFMPLLNWPIEIFNIFINDWHPMNITTLMESFSVLALVILVLFEGSKDLIFNYGERIWFKGLLATFIAGGFLLVYTQYENKPLDSFYCANIKAENSVSGFLRENGQYLGINGKEATVHLKTENILKDGLLLSFGRWDGIKTVVDEELAVFINDNYVAGKNIKGMGNEYIFVPAHELQEYASLSEVYITIVRQNSHVEYVPMLYIGPAVAQSSIHDYSMIHYATMGLEHNKGSLKAGNSISFLCDVDKFNNGLMVEYNAPQEYVNNPVNIKINGIRINNDYVRKVGKNLLYLSAQMLSQDMADKWEKDGVCNVEIEFCGVSDNIENNLEKISVAYIGDITELDEWDNVSLDNGYGRVILPASQIEEGVDIALDLSGEYNVKNTWVEVSQNNNNIGKYLLYNGESFQGIHIPPELLNLNETFVDLSFKVISDDSFIANSIKINHIATGTIKDNLNTDYTNDTNDTDDTDVVFNQGLIFDEQMRLWYMGEKGIVSILPRHEAKTLVLKYNVSEYLLKNSEVNIDLYVNGEKIYSGLPCALGNNEVSILLSEDILAKNNGCIQIMLISNRTYNLRRLHISRLHELGNDRSIGISYIGLE